MKIFNIIKGVLTRRQPLYLHFGITHDCNLNCKMCSLKNSNCDTLSLKELQKSIKVLKDLGIVNVSIGGGEPLLYNNLVDAVKLFSRMGIETRLLTNGTMMTTEKIEKLKDVGLGHISVSLDTLNKDKQDYICGKKGSGEKILNAVDIISRFFNRKNSIPIINTVVSKLNIKELLELANFAYNHDFYISYNPITFSYSLKNDFSFRQQDFFLIDTVFDKLIKKKKAGEEAIFNSYKFLNLSKRFFKKKEVDLNCFAGELFFSLECNGRLYICHHKNSPSVDITNFDFKDIEEYINSGEYEEKKRDFRNNCPGCVRPCWTEINLFFQDIETFLKRCKLHSGYLLKKTFSDFKNENIID